MNRFQILLSQTPLTAPLMRGLAYLKNDVLKPKPTDLLIKYMVPMWRTMKILEAGCGPGYKVGDLRFRGIDITCVDIYKPYLKICRNLGFKSVHADLNEIDKTFPPQSYDIVWFVDVIEHFPKKAGLRVLAKLEKIARKQIIVSTPLGFYPQDVLCVPDRNKYQQHRSAWYPADFTSRGYTCKVLHNYHSDIRSGAKSLISKKEPVAASQMWAVKNILRARS